MRLKSLLLGLMITSVFVACSKDNEVDPDGPKTGEDAILSVQIANVKTKALGDVKIDDKTISRLSVLVYNGTGDDAVLETIGTVTADQSETVSKVEDIAVTSGNKRVVVLANVTPEQLADGGVNTGSAYSSLESANLSFSSSEVNGTLSMNSKVYNVSLSPGKKNYLGYETVINPGDNDNYLQETNEKPVYLYRNVAKAVLSNITVNPLDRYPQASFTAKEVFILHGHSQSGLIGQNGDPWGKTNKDGNYLNGSTMQDYAAWVTYMEDYEALKQYNYISTPDKYSAYPTDVANKYKESLGDAKLMEGKDLDDLKDTKCFYMYENTDIATGDFHTLLVVKGDFTYQGVNEEGESVDVTSKDRYYTVALGLTGIDVEGYSLPGGVIGLSDLQREGQKKYKGALRNLQYKISMEIKGPGYTTPFGPKNTDDTFMGVQVQVESLKFISQSVDVGGE